MSYQTANEFRAWPVLSEVERERIFTGEDYLPLPETHAQRIKAVFGQSAREIGKKLLSDVPGFSATATGRFQRTEMLNIAESWRSPKDVQVTREWLHQRGVPYSTDVYLVYHEAVVATHWKILLTYWDAFAWSVGFAMHALNQSQSWICEFHHEDVITFQSYR